MKKNLIKIIIAIVLIVLIVFLGNTLRKFLIIHKIENKLVEVSTKENYYMKMTSENFSINGYNENIFRSLNANKKLSSSGNNTMVQLAENEIYSFDNEKKVYIKSPMLSILGNFKNVLPYYFSHIVPNKFDEFSIIGQLKIALKSNVKKADFRGVESYAISFKWKEENNNYLSTMYIDKDTLLLVAIETILDNNKSIETFEIQFDTQTEDDLNVDNLFQEYTEITPQN